MRVNSKPKAVLLVHGFALLAGLSAVLFALRSTQVGRAADTESGHRQIVLGQAEAGSLYAITLSVLDPAKLQSAAAVHVSVSDARGPAADKYLPAADLDFYLTLAARAGGNVTAQIDVASGVSAPA